MSTNRVGQCYLTKKVRRNLALQEREQKRGSRSGKYRPKEEIEEKKAKLKANRDYEKKLKARAIRAEIRAAKQMRRQNKREA